MPPACSLATFFSRAFQVMVGTGKCVLELLSEATNRIAEAK